MKRYEIMSQEEIMKAYNIPCKCSGENKNNKCENCVVWQGSAKKSVEPMCAKEKGLFCLDIVRNYLNETVKVHKRYELLTNDEAVEKICSLYKFFYTDNKKDLNEFLCEWVEDEK